MADQQYSPGMIDVVDKKAARLIKDLYDRVNWLSGEIERMQKMAKDAIPAAGGSSPNISKPAALLPVGPDQLVSPSVVPGQTMGGTELWGVTFINMPNADYTIPFETAYQNRSMRFIGTLTALRVVSMPQLNGKMWIISNPTAQTLRFRVGGVTGNTTDVPTGATAVIFCFNTDIFLGARGV